MSLNWDGHHGHEDDQPRRELPHHGDRVEVIYKLETDRLPRKMTVTYLESSNGMDGLKHVFSGRPLFGTTDLYDKYIESIHVVDPDTKVSRPVIVRS